MLKVVDDWLGDPDLVRYIDRLFTYKTPHHLIEYADSTYAPSSIFGRNDDQEVEAQIFYSYDFDPNNPLIKFLVIKAMETVEDLTGRTQLNCLRVHLAIQHPEQDVEWHSDGSDLTVVYTASSPGGGDFTFDVDGEHIHVQFANNKLIVFDGAQRHMALAPQGTKRPRILLVIKLGK
tara:strand:- start:414 stop:944 length:531 start_codon:yes stop_codon:yes gene_type:complete